MSIEGRLALGTFIELAGMVIICGGVELQDSLWFIWKPMVVAGLLSMVVGMVVMLTTGWEYSEGD